MGCSHLPSARLNQYSRSCSSCLEKLTMRFKSNKAGTADAGEQQKKEESTPSSKSSSAFNSTSTWPSFQIPLKKQWHRRQAFMDNVGSTDKENPFLAALENPKPEPLSSCLKDLDKTHNDSFKGSSFLTQPFSSQSMSCFRPKPKGLVDGLSRFFTPTNKRKSRVAISSLGDTLTLDGEMQTNNAAGHSFSGKQLCDQNSMKKMCSSDFDNKLHGFSDILPSGVANSSPSTFQSSLSPAPSFSLFNSAKPSGSGQVKNLFDGLSHLYTAPTDSRKRPLKGFPNEPSTKRLRKSYNNCTDNDFNNASLFCDRNSTGDMLHDKSKDSKLEMDCRQKVLDSDCEASSSFLSSPSCSSIKSVENCRSDEIPFVNNDSKLSYSQLCSSVPEKSYFGLTSPLQTNLFDVQTDVSKPENDEDNDAPFTVTEDDRLLFQQVQEKAEEDIKVRTDSSTLRKPSYLQFGKYEIAVIYPSPYPKEYLRLSKIFLCEFCLKFMRSIKTLDRHMMKCTLTHPPADEIYRKGDISVFEVDGVTNKTYCQNLCLLAKMFLDHKTLFYDVESFLFYILTKNDKKGCHLVGYFSKERFCQQRYNVSCIMIMPQHQRKGYGRFLIDFSYLLSKKEGRFGTPEKPLSELGQLCYSSYWESVVIDHLNRIDREKKITVKSICKATGMTFSDVVSTLTSLNMVKRNDFGKILITIEENSYERHLEEINKKRSQRIVLDPDCLAWEPQVEFRSNCKKCRKEASKLRDKRKQFTRSNNKLDKMIVGGIWYAKERIKCETCLLSQERERRRLLKHKNKRKLTEKHAELESLLEPKKKRVKISSLHSSLIDSSDDSIDYLRYTTAKIKNLKRKLLKKHKLKLQKKYQEQKQETDILKYAVLGESKNSKIKVHGFLRKSSKLNIECQKKFKHKRYKKERYKKMKRKEKSKNLSQELSKDKKKHKVKMKKKDNKSSEKDTDRDGVTTPPVLLPAVLSDEDSSQNSNSASEQDLSPPPLLQASMMESAESKPVTGIEVKETVEETALENGNEADIESEIISEVLPEESEAVVSEEVTTKEEISEEEVITLVEDQPKSEDKEEIVLSPEVVKEIEEVVTEDINESDSTDQPVNTVEAVSSINDADVVNQAVAPLLSSVENIEKDTYYNDENCILEDAVSVEKDELESSDVPPSEVPEPITLPVEDENDLESSKNIDSSAVEIVFEQTANMDMSSIHVPDQQVQESEHISLHNELKTEEEDNEVREAVEVINEQMEHSSNIDLPLTPQTPESEHSRNYQHLSPYHSQQECDGSVEEIDDPNNMDCQELEDDSVNKMNDEIQECNYTDHHKDNIQQVSSNETYTPEMIEQPDIIVDIPQVSQPLSQVSQTSQLSNPSTPVGTIVTKHTPTPQEMSSMGVYTPDSSTNSGYNSVEIDVCQLGLESPTSVCSSEIAQNSVEARSSTPQSYPDCAQLNNTSPYCANASISEPCSNTNRREMIAAAAAAQAAVVQAQAQAHHTNQSSHCVNVSNRKRQHNAAISQRITNIPPSGSVPTLMQSSMVSVNATAVNALFVGPAPNTNNGYMNAMNMSVPCSNATAGGGPVAGSYMVGVPVATVIQPQSAAAFAAASMQNHHQLQQSPQNFSVANHPTGTIPGAMQRLTHVGVSPSIAPNTCPVSSVTPNFHIQSPSYTYTPTPTPTPNTPSQIGTSCSLAKLQQLTNGIMDIVPNPPCNTMTPPPNMTPPSPQVNMTPPPQMQRSLTPAMTSLQPQISMQSGPHNYSKYHFHHRQMQRNANVALSPNLVASYQTINGVGYRIQQAPSAAAMLNTGYITNASFINQAQLPPSAAVQMGMVNVNMHGQNPYQETLQTNRQQNAMYTTYSYHISSNLQPQSLNSVMRR